MPSILLNLDKGTDVLYDKSYGVVIKHNNDIHKVKDIIETPALLYLDTDEKDFIYSKKKGILLCNNKNIEHVSAHYFTYKNASGEVFMHDFVSNIPYKEVCTYANIFCVKYLASLFSHEESSYEDSLVFLNFVDKWNYEIIDYAYPYVVIQVNYMIHSVYCRRYIVFNIESKRYESYDEYVRIPVKSNMYDVMIFMAPGKIVVYCSDNRIIIDKTGDLDIYSTIFCQSTNHTNLIAVKSKHTEQTLLISIPYLKLVEIPYNNIFCANNNLCVIYDGLRAIQWDGTSDNIELVSMAQARNVNMLEYSVTSDTIVLRNQVVPLDKNDYVMYDEDRNVLVVYNLDGFCFKYFYYISNSHSNNIYVSERIDSLEALRVVSPVCYKEVVKIAKCKSVKL